MNKTCKTHAQNRCLKSVRKIRVIWSQNGVQKGHLKRPKAYIFRHIFACYFRHVFVVVLGSKCIENGSKKGSKMWPKIMKNRRPRQNAILERFGVDFWQILDRFGVDFWVILGSCGTDFWLILIRFFARILAQVKQRKTRSLRKRTNQLQQKSIQLSKKCAFRPTSLLTRSNTPSAATQRRFFDDFSDAFLERFWVDFGVPFGGILGLKRVQNDVENRCKNRYRKKVWKMMPKGSNNEP